MSFHSKKIRIDLANARDNERINVKGGFIRAVDASSDGAIVEIAIDNNIGDNDQFPFRKRAQLTYGGGFEKLYLVNTAQAGEWIDIVVSPSKEIFDFEAAQNFVVDSITDTVETLELKAATLDSVADVALNNGSATLLAASDTTRRELFVTNLLANGVSIRVGDSGVTASNGIELQPGDSITLTTTAAVYAFVGSASKNAAVMSIKD